MPKHDCITYGTTYMGTAVFRDAVSKARPGEAICYASGALDCSSEFSPDLALLRNAAYKLSERRMVRLTQRVNGEKFKHGGRSFDYLATKCQPKQPRHHQSTSWLSKSTPAVELDRV